MTNYLAARITGLIGPDVAPATDDLVVRLAETVRDVREHEHEAADDIYCANLKAWMGQGVGALLARLLHAGTINARQRTLLREAAEQVTACPPPNPMAGEEGCAHGGWPCQGTNLAWKLRGLDPDAERARIMREIRHEMAIAAQAQYPDPSDNDPDGPS